jgi:O-antigen ligase
MTTSSPSTRVPPAPSWFESALFLALMSGPPKFRGRDALASLAGTIDLVVLIHVAVWTCGGLWVMARLYSTAVRHGVIPSPKPPQVIGGLFIAVLGLSIADSPGTLLTIFTLGQLAVMLGFLWLFTRRFGAAACLRHCFIGVSVLAVATIAAFYLLPDVVTTDITPGETRFLGNYIAETGSVGVIGLVLCLSSVPRLRGPVFWGALCLFGGLLVASRTRSAFAALVVFLAVGFLYGKRLPIRKLVVPLAALTLGVVLMNMLPSTVDYLVREPESLNSMSDRIPLWEHLTDAVMREAPLTGLGYYAASRVVATEYNPNLGTAHSVFFEVLVGGGVLGAVLYLVLCASLVWYAAHLLWRASGQPSAVAAAGLLVVTLLMGVTSETAMHAGPLGFAFWSTTALLPELWREAARAMRRAGPRTAIAPMLSPRHTGGVLS